MSEAVGPRIIAYTISKLPQKSIYRTRINGYLNSLLSSRSPALVGVDAEGSFFVRGEVITHPGVVTVEAAQPNREGEASRD